MKRQWNVICAMMIALVATGVEAQVDPGVSANNYKHPNKARAARQPARTVEVETIAEAEKRGQGTVRSTTPKYRKRHEGLVIEQEDSVNRDQINPTKQPAHYKAR